MLVPRDKRGQASISMWLLRGVNAIACFSGDDFWKAEDLFVVPQTKSWDRACVLASVRRTVS